MMPTVIAEATQSQLNWFDVVLPGALGLVGAFVGVRLWKGQQIVRWNSRTRQDRLAPMMVTVVPGSIAFIALALGSAMLIVHDHVGNEAIRAVTATIAVAMGAIVAIGIGFSITLIIFSKPKWLLPPHIRKMKWGG